MTAALVCCKGLTGGVRLVRSAAIRGCANIRLKVLVDMFADYWSAVEYV
jgi:hypothetical protein